MTFTIRTGMCTLLLLLLSTVLSFASTSPLRVMIQPVSESIRLLRYQVGPEVQPHWTEVEEMGSSILLETFDVTQDRLFVQQSQDTSSWSEVHTYQYDPVSEDWMLCAEPIDTRVILDSVDVKFYGLLPVGRSSTFYSHMLGAAAKMNIAMDTRQDLIGYGQIAYSIGPSKSDWVDTLQALNLSFGMGYRFELTDRLQFAPELGYGLVLHLLHADFDEDGSETFEIFIDQQVRLSAALSFDLTDTYTLIIAPVGVMFFEKDTIGMLLGFQSGLRFNF